ncbi:MAG: hypothetical protein CUN54_08475 [Phototrophicales bacterium]|nr:MAG: hypothetical protein CUN54_08475 [Phototrophicales bacterium]
MLDIHPDIAREFAINHHNDLLKEAEHERLVKSIKNSSNAHTSQFSLVGTILKWRPRLPQWPNHHKPHHPTIDFNRRVMT